VIDPLLGLRLRGVVIEQIRQRHEPVEVVRAALPALAAAAKPGTARADIGPDLVETVGHVGGLHGQLILEPAGRTYRAEPERPESFMLQRSRILGRSRLHAGECYQMP
jgi:hypothetical protein